MAQCQPDNVDLGWQLRHFAGKQALAFAHLHGGIRGEHGLVNPDQQVTFRC